MSRGIRTATPLLRVVVLAAASAMLGCGDDARESTSGDGATHPAGQDAAAMDSMVPSDDASIAPSPDAAPADATTGERTPDAAPTDATSGEGGPTANGCPAGMSRVTTFCVDTYEAYVVEVDDAGVESPHSPYATLGDGVVARARVAAGVVPQAYVSQVQAAAACAQAGKRLCAASEFTLACRGADAGDDYPYGGTTRVAGDCNEGQGSPLPVFFGADSSSWTYADLNDPRLDDRDGGLVPSGSLPRCISPFGVADCVGNVIEWGADPQDSNGHARLRGGSMADSELNGRGCLYVTTVHEPTYHDYTTGFRCCADPPP